MKKKLQRDALQLLETFQRRVLERKPPMREMIAEIHMMKFKIKPVQGDFSAVNFNNDKFIETLWQLGKLDEFFQTQYPHLLKKEQNTFFTYIESMQKKLQEELNRLNLRQVRTEETPAILEMEIFKERLRKRKPN